MVNSEAKVIVEIGSWLGLSASLFLKHAPESTIVCIDHWRGSAEHRRNPDWRRRLPTLYEQFLANMWESREHVIPVRARSTKGLAIVRECEIVPDLIYIDGAHDRPSVYADISTSATLFPGVPLLGHDWRFASVRTAVWHAARQEIMSATPTLRHGINWWSFTND
jgi:hypothetical protein